MISVLFTETRKDWTGEEGFSLLSLVFLILILSFSAMAIFTTILPSALTQQNKETVEKVSILRHGIQSYAFSHGGISGLNPPTLDRLVVTDGSACLMDTNPLNETYLTLQGWCGPYLDQILVQNPNDFKIDGWGSFFDYNAVTGIIKSCGRDRLCGNADDVTFNP